MRERGKKMQEYKKPNVLECIAEEMEQGYTEDEAALMWFCLFADSWSSDDE